MQVVGWHRPRLGLATGGNWALRRGVPDGVTVSNCCRWHEGACGAACRCSGLGLVALVPRDLKEGAAGGGGTGWG